MPHSAKAVLFEAADSVTLGTVDIPEPQAGELLVRNRVTCISPGTELRCLAGKQRDMPDWPVIPGYASCGEVVARGEGTLLPEGTLVRCHGTARASVNRCWGAHCSHLVVNESHVQVVPEAVAPRQAALARLAAIAYRGVRLSRPLPDQSVAVIGLGAIGQLSARLHAVTGCRVLGVDRDPSRVALLRAAGVEAVEAAESSHRAVREVFPHGVDIVVDATGVSAAVPDAVEALRTLPWADEPGPSPVYIIQGSYPHEVSLPYGPLFGREAIVRFPRDCQPRDLEAMLSLIERGGLVVDDLVSRTIRPEEASAVYEQLRDPANGLITVAMDWS
jgi:2-desacetyl-2-hydroxyethyl bacteriochlorophyllide A dehydrogenase